MASRLQMRKKQIANRRRNGYELTTQRDMVPIALGAATAAILVHAAAFFASPSLLHFAPDNSYEKKIVNEEVIRVFVKPPPMEKDYTEAQEENEPEELPPPREEMEHEDAEIDILDADYEELTLAPGETDLFIPEPKKESEETLPTMTMTPAELNMKLIGKTEVSPEALQVAEPTPINANTVVVRAQAKLEDLEGANSLMDSELRKGSQEGNGGLSDDTRTLSELIGMDNLGSESGVARLDADLLFGFNQCKLSSPARVTMVLLAALIEKNPDTNFIIEGHTDSFGGEKTNAILSLQRAAAVREWLKLNKLEIKNVYIRACANKSPIERRKNANKDDQAKNRRVEIHMRRKSEKLPEGCYPSTYAVDMSKKPEELLQQGTPVPPTYTSASASIPKRKPARK